MPENSIEMVLMELIEHQRKRLLRLAKEIVPHITEDDLLQPFDFPQIEHHPGFRYEEGVLEGFLTVQMALLAKKGDVL